MPDKKIKLSINKFLIDKNKPADLRYFREGFENAELTLEELRDHVNDGHAFSYQYRDGHRKTDNFIASDFLAVDVDHGLTIEQAFDHPIVQRYCSMFYLTPRHTPDHHRFRLFFILPRTITTIKEIKAAAKSITRMLGGDFAATDAARFFFGFTDSSPLIYDRSITEDFLEVLIANGLTEPATESVAFAGSTANRSSFRPEPTMLVRTSDNQMVEVQSIEKSTPIHCHSHDDKNPSAFVSRTLNRSLFIHCPVCQQTWWVQGTKPYERSFEDFDQQVRRIKDTPLPDQTAGGPLSEIFEFSPIKRENIHITNDEHLRISGLDDGLTLIKSPKGTGKTTYLSGVLASIINRYATFEDYENDTDFDSEKPFYSKDRILLIGHRRALIGDLCQRLKLNCYLDDSKHDHSENAYRKQRYGVCLDSLMNVRDEKYDIVVIDEVEQVLSHFLSDTVGEKRRGLFELFSQVLRNAKKVVALDADLGWISFITLTHLTREREARDRQTGQSSSTAPLRSQVVVYLNDWQPKNKNLLIYPSMFQLVHDIKKSLVDGKRIFITSNSKTKIKALTKSIIELEGEIGQEIPMIAITSDNSESKESQHFIKNIKTEILNYQVVLASPSLGTGIDITFDNGASEIDAVYGLFENQINTHFEIDQQLARVRNPGSVHVWISPRTFEFETEFQVVAQDYLHRHLMDLISSGYDQNGWDVMFTNVDPFLRMAALITSHQRASKNNLKRNFLEYRKSQGWSITLVEEDEPLRDLGKSLFNIGRDISQNEWIQSVLSAQVMDRIDYEVFKEKDESNDHTTTADEWSAFYRTHLELFYCEPVTQDLITRDHKGKLRKMILLFERVQLLGATDYKVSSRSSSKYDDAQNTRLKQQLFKDRTTAAYLLHGLLSLTPLFKDGVFDLDATVTTDDLKKFVAASVKLKSIVLTQLEIGTQADIEQKPTQHLGKLLGVIGLDLKKVKEINVGKRRIYHYGLDLDKFSEISDIVERRKASSNGGWDFVDQKYHFKYTKDQQIWIFDRRQANWDYSKGRTDLEFPAFFTSPSKKPDAKRPAKG